MYYEVLKGMPIFWVIVGCGLLAMGVFVERALHLHRARIRTEDFLKGIFNVLRRGNIKEALTICDDTPGPVAYVVKSAILNRAETREVLRSALDDASMAEISRMERRLAVIATVAQIAPMLGLLGTVLGMINCVLVMQNQVPLVQTADVMNGLLSALLSTAAGLTVSIPCYAAFNLLVVKIDRLVLDMDKAVSELMAFSPDSAPDNQVK